MTRRPWDAASQLSLLEPAAETVKAFMCFYDPQCNQKAVLGPKRYNASGTCMNRSATCCKCGRAGELSYNLTLARKAQREQVA